MSSLCARPRDERGTPLSVCAHPAAVVVVSRSAPSPRAPPLCLCVPPILLLPHWPARSHPASIARAPSASPVFDRDLQVHSLRRQPLNAGRARRSAGLSSDDRQMPPPTAQKRNAPPRDEQTTRFSVPLSLQSLHAATSSYTSTLLSRCRRPTQAPKGGRIGARRPDQRRYLSVFTPPYRRPPSSRSPSDALARRSRVRSSPSSSSRWHSRAPLCQRSFCPEKNSTKKVSLPDARPPRLWRRAPQAAGVSHL